MTADPPTLEPGQTIRAFITAERWIEIRHDGWSLKVTGNRGAWIAQPDKKGEVNIISTGVVEEEL